MSWLSFEEERTDYLGQVVAGVSTGVALLVGWATAGLALAVDAPFMAFNLVAGILVAASELTMEYTNQALDAAGLREWWAIEHSVMAIAFACMLPSLLRKNQGDCPKMLLQLVASVKGLVWIATFFHFAQGIQGGVVFEGKLAFPTLMLLALLLQGFYLNFVGMMKEIHGYGMEDGPADVKTQKVLGMFETGTFLEGAIAASIATFGLPDVNCDGEDMRPWLVVCPLIGFITMLNEWSKDPDGAPAAPEEGKANGEAVAVSEEAAKEPEEAPKEEGEGEKSDKEKIAAEEGEKKEEEAPAEEKEAETESKEPEEPKAEEPAKVSAVAKICSLCTASVAKVKGLICCAVSHVVALVNLVVSKVLALVNLVVDKVMSLPWACILDTVSSLGSNALVALVFHALTDDLLCLTFPVVNLVLPLLLAKLQERDLVTKSTAFTVTEVAKSSAYVVQYYLFSHYITKPEA